MTDLPSPLVPVDCDLRDFQWMPVDIVRLFGSNFHAQANDSEWRAGVTLWLKSYHQVPAASLPDDDAALARLAELGRDQKTWKKLRPAALHGWVKCDDGRLYHKVVAEKALEAWIDKLQQRKVSAAGNAKRWGGEASIVEIERAADRAVEMLRALNPNSRTLAKRSRRSSGTEGSGNQPALPLPHPQETRQDANGSPVVIPSGSQGTRTEPKEEKKEPNHHQPSPSASADDDDQFDYEVLLDKLCRAAGITKQDRLPGLLTTGPISDMIDAGWSLEKHILPKIMEMTEKGQRGASWQYYATSIKNGADTPPKAKPPPKTKTETLDPSPEAAKERVIAKMAERDGWASKLSQFKKTGNWSEHWGAPPGQPGCPILPEFIEKFERQLANGAH